MTLVTVRRESVVLIQLNERGLPCDKGVRERNKVLILWRGVWNETLVQTMLSQIVPLFSDTYPFVSETAGNQTLEM